MMFVSLRLVMRSLQRTPAIIQVSLTAPRSADRPNNCCRTV